MDKHLNNSVNNNSPNANESETNKSFVGKFKSHVSGIINNTPLSKWFRKDETAAGAPIRRRADEFEDDELYAMQPPTKRQKLPTDTSQLNNYPRKLNLTDSPPQNSYGTKNALNIFPEPVAGPSGISSRKLIERTTFHTQNDLINGHKESDSEESSGYSSVLRIGSKEQVCESRDSSKQTSPLEHSPPNTRTLFQSSNMNRSLFTDRSPNLNTSLSSRRPSFNASLFGSPNFIDKTLITKRIINSPFYNGRTIYGGASAYSGRQPDANQRTSGRNSIQIKPVNKTATEKAGNLTLGKTARRILDTLEQYSTPVNDAKKIPIKKRTNSGGILSKYTGANPYLVCDKRVASNKELQVPSVTDLLKMKRARLQDSTESVRQMATASKSVLNTESYQLPTVESSEQPLKRTNKMKSKVSAVRPHKSQQEERVQEVPLKAVSLPITTLPKFDLNVLPPSGVAAVPLRKERDVEKMDETKMFPKRNPVPGIKETEVAKTSSKLVYKFSEPIVIAENVKSIIAINNFKFSEPICKKSRKEQIVTMNFKMPATKLPLLPQCKSGTVNGESFVRPASELLKTGSVMDVLGKKMAPTQSLDKFKPAEGTWECSVCLIRNNGDKEKCVACETLRATAKKEAKTNSTALDSKQMTKDQSPGNATILKFGDKFKPPTDTWGCDVCMIRNKNELEKCAACASPRNGKKTANNSQGNSLLEKFKPPSDTWECNVCMVRNKTDVVKCVACNSAKEGSTSAVPTFGGDFKMKENEWECPTCVVRNKMTSNKCLCCETPKPGASVNSSTDLSSSSRPVTKFCFGIDKSVTSSFTFGIPPTKAEASAVPATVPSIFGQPKATSATGSEVKFAFGIPPQSNTSEESKEDKSKGDKVVEKQAEKAVEVNNVSKNEATSVPIVQPAEESKKTEPKPMFNFQPSSLNGDLNHSASLFNSKVNEFKSDPVKTDSTQNTTTQQNVTGVQQSQSDAGSKPLFGSNKAPVFGGATSLTSADKPLNNGFGATSATFGSGTGFSAFGSTATTQATSTLPTTAKSTFSFQPKSAEQASSKGGAVFAFGQTATTATTLDAPKVQSTFNFGSNSAANKPTGGTPQMSFSFGSGNKSEQPPPPSNTFGNNNKNGIFNFGSAGTNNNNNNQKAGFNFGTSNATPNQPAIFNFGTNAPSAAPTQAAPPSVGGFNFTATAPAFGTSIKPTFNFTDGNNITAFNAPPPANDGVSAPPARKIKRAVRRTPR